MRLGATAGLPSSAGVFGSLKTLLDKPAVAPGALWPKNGPIRNGSGGQQRFIETHGDRRRIVQSILFHIPNYVPGTQIPVFGLGLLLAVWAVLGIGLVGWLARHQGFNADTRGHLPLLAAIGLIVWFMLPRMTNQIGLPIPGYGVMLMFGFGGGVALAWYRAQRMGLDPEVILNLAFWMFVGGIVGARLFFIIQYWDTYRIGPHGKPLPWSETLGELVNVTQGGLVIYGSVMGVAVVLLFYFRKYRLPALAISDLIAPSAMLGLALGRIGCLLNGCCFGGQCEHAWAVTFPWGSPPHKSQATQGEIYVHGLKLAGDTALGWGVVIDQVLASSPAESAGLQSGMRITQIGGIPVTTLQGAYAALLRVANEGQQLHLATASAGAVGWTLHAPPPRSKPVHPTQIYSAINAALLCLLLLAYYPLRRRDGEVFALLITLYPITRFLLEIVRMDEPGRFGTMLSISQWVSLVMLGLAITLWVVLIRYRPRGSVLPATTQG